jgi:hypothetical protein
MRLGKSVGSLIIASSLAFGLAQGQETSDSTDAGTAPASEQRPQGNHDRPPRKPMSDEERAAKRERFDNMSDEEKQALRQKHGERRAKWEAMSPDEQRAMRDRMKQRQGDRPKGERGSRPPRDSAPDAV